MIGGHSLGVKYSLPTKVMGAIPIARSKSYIMYELKDYLNAINFEKKPLLDSEDSNMGKEISSLYHQ